MTRLEIGSATASGVTFHLGDGRDPARLAGLLEGDRGGTVVHPHPEPLGNRRSWLAEMVKATDLRSVLARVVGSSPTRNINEFIFI